MASLKGITGFGRGRGHGRGRGRGLGLGGATQSNATEVENKHLAECYKFTLWNIYKTGWAYCTALRKNIGRICYISVHRVHLSIGIIKINENQNTK